MEFAWYGSVEEDLDASRSDSLKNEEETGQSKYHRKQVGLESSQPKKEDKDKCRSFGELSQISLIDSKKAKTIDLDEWEQYPKNEVMVPVHPHQTNPYQS